MSILDDARPGMDPDTRPQDDLFGHVNGRWLEETEIPSDRSSWGPFVQLADAAEAQVRDIITDLAALATAPDQEAPDEDARKIGDLFASFMDTEAIAAKGIEPVRPLLDAAARLRDKRDLAAFLGEFERIGGHGLFGSYVDTDDKQSDRYLFHLVQGGLGLPDESYYRDDKHAETREKYVAYLTRLLGLADHADPEGAARTILAIDTRLAAGHWERAATRDVQKTYNLRTLAELQEMCPGFDFDVYVTNLTASTRTAADVLGEVCVRQPSYFEHLSTVLEEVPVEQWRDWLTSHVLRATAAYLPDDFVETNFDFYGRTLSGTPELRARWKRGVALVEGALGEAVGRVYVERHFPPRSKQMMDDLVANLLAAYRVSISRLDWMTEETKERAYEKLATFRPKIGYPETFRDYSALQVRQDDLMGNVAAASAFETEIAIERDVIAQVRSAYTAWQASLEVIDSTTSAVSAAQLSLEGVRAENSVGNRTILDILDAEQELLRAEVQLVTARRNAYVAGFSLLAAMGMAEAEDLNLDVGRPLYDPTIYYESVDDAIFDFRFEPDPVAEATRTVDTPAQDATIPGE